MISDFDKLVDQRRQLQSWWRMRTTIAEYDRKYFTLRVDANKPALVTFCGQHSCGGRNYHDAPPFFVVAVGKEFQRHAITMAESAYESEMARLTEAIEKHRVAVLAELDKASVDA